MSSSTLVHDSSPAGKDIIFLFSTVQDGEPLDFTQSPSFLVYVYDGSEGGVYGEDDIITTIVYGVDDDIFIVDEEAQLVSVTVPWDREEAAGSMATGISQYNPNFKGEIYAHLLIEMPVSAADYTSSGSSPPVIDAYVQNAINHIKVTRIHKPDWIIEAEAANKSTVWATDRDITLGCYTNLGMDPDDTGICVGGCDTNHITMIPIRADYVPGSCEDTSAPLRSAITFAAQWSQDSHSAQTFGDCCDYWAQGEHPRANISYVVSTFDNEEKLNLQSVGVGRLQVFSCPSMLTLPLPDIQLVSVNPSYFVIGNKRISGIPLNDNNLAWVRIDLDAPVTYSGNTNLSEEGGNCFCNSTVLPCACPGILYGCPPVYVATPNVFLDTLPNVDPWKAPILDGSGVCCQGCEDASAVPAARPYKECQIMFKGAASDCSGTNPEASKGYWAQSCVYQCGVSYNFWLRGEDK